ncbi:MULTISPECIES: hypothetical protein [unclassified Duganella]|uniref:hypothetical protein n=1 Tax=unclassified Duganella TaxID=2636909 RepID=UPI00088EC8A7|nr:MULTISPECIES: hypothetical protein [unclassified Duganella]SDF60513.1 hypothetical protein SAMN05216320_101713 [Duganella sp. OV458]SDI68267.1 hypothetical protein SAMN05428973_101702 [Duganella sp. OV510]
MKPPSLQLVVRSLDEHLSSDQSFSSAYARAVGAIAGNEGSLTLAQFAAVTDIAGDGQSSAVFTALVLNAIESGVEVDWALNALGRSCTPIDQAAREQALHMVVPLLALHGADARALAQRFAKSLSVRLTPDDLNRLPQAEERGLLANLGEQARRLVRGRSLADAVADFGRTAGQPALVDHARNFQSGDIDQMQLRELVGNSTAVITQDINLYLEQARLLSLGEAAASSLVSAANDLKSQVTQRLVLVEQRIAYERRLLIEEIDDAVHDAGNAIELVMTDRLNTDKWKDEDVWSSIGRNQFGQEMERRLDRIVRRKEQALHLLQEDLRLFQSGMRLGQATVFQRQHHAALAKLMPRLRVGTRIVNKLDTAANVTLVSGAAVAASTGTAAYLIGAAVVLPVVAPVAPFVGGAVLLAGAFKWFTDGGKRKRMEIRDKRVAFEEELRKQLLAAEQSFNTQLDLVAEGFRDSALQLLTPIVLEAEAAGRVPGMRQRIADRVITQAQAAIRQLDAELR